MSECNDCKHTDCCFLALICIPYDYKYFNHNNCGLITK